MFFLNLSVLEFLGLFGALSSFVVALYLLDRVRKRHTVATLRFLKPSERPPQLKHRRKLQQPWSLALQLLSLLLLLLALAQLRIGSRERAARDHVLILDSSAWMGSRTGQNRLIDEARSQARAYLRRLPSNDRVMLVRADALATPATPFETDRLKLQQAIDQTQPSAGALDIAGALRFARQAQNLQGGHPGEIAFIGAGRIDSENEPAAVPSNVRLISVGTPQEHCGLTKMGAQRSASKPGVWEIFVSAKNYGRNRRSVPLILRYGGAVIGSKRMDLEPGSEQSANFEYQTVSGGWLDARLLANDSFGGDEHAVLELPPVKTLSVTVISDSPELLKPVFNSMPGIKAIYLPVSKYNSATIDGVAVLDHFAPSVPPAGPSIWLAPPPSKSPVTVRATANKVKLTGWRADHPLAAGLRAKNLELETTEIFRPGDQDVAIASSAEGPVALARSGKTKMVVLGFNPVQSAALKYELVTPLLFANMLRWVEPDIFRRYELTAGSVGAIDVNLEADADPSGVRVITEDGKTLPFTLNGTHLRFFSNAPGIVQVLTENRALVYSLTLPRPGEIVWNPANVRKGLPSGASSGTSSRDVWQWLALLATAALIGDWILFGRMHNRRAFAVPVARQRVWKKAS